MFSLPTNELYEIGFKDKEIQKVIAFGSIVAPILNNYSSKKLSTIIDLCSGNGLSSFAFQFNNLANKSLMIDIKKPKRFDKIKKLFEAYGFEYSYPIEDITSEEFQLSNFCKLEKSAIVSIHPCSRLGDKVIDIALRSELPFALMTCCHQVKREKYKLNNPPDPRLMLYDEPTDYYDLVRQRYIEEQGWDCYWKEIPKEITEKNHVLIGLKKTKRFK